MIQNEKFLKHWLVKYWSSEDSFLYFKTVLIWIVFRSEDVFWNIINYSFKLLKIATETTIFFNLLQLRYTKLWFMFLRASPYFNDTADVIEYVPHRLVWTSILS